jgi:hypothetical protein
VRPEPSPAWCHIYGHHLSNYQPVHLSRPGVSLLAQHAAFSDLGKLCQAVRSAGAHDPLPWAYPSSPYQPLIECPLGSPILTLPHPLHCVRSPCNTSVTSAWSLITQCFSELPENKKILLTWNPQTAQYLAHNTRLLNKKLKKSVSPSPISSMHLALPLDTNHPQTDTQKHLSCEYRVSQGKPLHHPDLFPHVRRWWTLWVLAGTRFLWRLCHL